MNLLLFELIILFINGIPKIVNNSQKDGVRLEEKNSLSDVLFLSLESAAQSASENPSIAFPG